MLTARLFTGTSNKSIASVVDYYVGKYYVRDEKTKGPESPGQWLGAGAERLGLKGIVTKSSLYYSLKGKSADGKKQLSRIQRQKKKTKPDNDDDDDGGGGEGADSDPEDGPNVRSSKRKKSKPSKTQRNKADSPSIKTDATTKKKPKKNRVDHVPGMDLTFSVPKEVSMLYALGDDRIKQVVIEATEYTARKAMQLIESELPLIRRGKGGQRREHGKLVYSFFNHFAARNNNDPNIHLHILLMNMILAEDGGIFKLDTHMLLKFVRTLGPLLRNEIYCYLHRELGVEAYRPIENGKQVSWFGLVGFDAELKSQWSSRNGEIVDAVELDGTSASDVHAKQAANLRTRTPKEHQFTLAELQEKWLKEAAELGVTPQSIVAALGRDVSVDRDVRLAEAVKVATEKLTDQNSTFSRFEFIRAISEELQDVAIEAKQVINLADNVLAQSPQLRVVKENGVDKVVTTEKIWQLEEKVTKQIDSLAARPGLAIEKDCIELAIAKNPNLSTEQSTAVRELLSSKGSLACLTGVAGAGKSTTLRTVVEALELSGKEVIGLSLGAAPARGLQCKTGAESTTIARFLCHTEKAITKKVWESAKHHLRMFAREVSGNLTWTRDTSDVPKIHKEKVILIDEAAMVNTSTFSRVLTQAERVGAKVIVIGDLSQNPPIGAGCPFKEMIEKVGDSKLIENWRQTPREAEASRLIREGEIEKALKIYAKDGNLNIAENRKEAASQLVSNWAKDCGIKNPEKAMVLVQTNREVKQLNQICQSARLLEDAISSKHVRIGESNFHVKDRIMFVAPIRKYGIVNSDMATITNIDRLGNLTVRVDRELTRKEIAMGLKKEFSITKKDLVPSKQHPEIVRLGYAATVSKLQGASIDRIFALAGGSMTNRNMFYVTASRSIEKCQIYIDRDHAGHKLAAISTSASKHVEKLTAHEIANELKKS